jgi:hypothetical protein
MDPTAAHSFTRERALSVTPAAIRKRNSRRRHSEGQLARLQSINTIAHRIAWASRAAVAHDLGRQLLSAAEDGDVEVVCELLDDGANVNYSATRGGTTVLLWVLWCHGCTNGHCWDSV